ncbi:arsenic resistance N-acetyltransferase ArsN2 [Ideonella sp. DXS29W]|uniref:Arsenic resistance N-acetyltransferase ArsN2 n=1 Tax=Ideonella lacteola TaxID=2984193 RepID=A0ABU9C0Y8_9BURK
MSLNDAITLRQADIADWHAIAALLQAHHLPLQGAREHLSSFVVALRNNEIVGVAGIEVHGHAALLRSVAVAPGQQRAGIGESLVARLLDEARLRQIRQVVLLTTTAAQYFTRFGFEVAGADAVPDALQVSAEFQGACPASATFMRLALDSSGGQVQATPNAAVHPEPAIPHPPTFGCG